MSILEKKKKGLKSMTSAATFWGLRGKKQNGIKNQNIYQWNWKQNKTIERINKIKNWFLENFNKIYKPVAILIRVKMEYINF